MPELTYEDFTPGRVFDLGTATADGAEMLAFARRFDPQPFHLDAEAAKASVLGGLCASGWYTIGLWMRAWVDHVLSRSSSQGSPGGTEIAWPAPVFPGDLLTARAEVLSARTSARRPTLGLVEVRSTLHRDEVCVFRGTFTALFSTRS